MMVIDYVYTFISLTFVKALSQLLAFLSPRPGRQRGRQHHLFCEPQVRSPLWDRAGSTRAAQLTERLAGEG